MNYLNQMLSNTKKSLKHDQFVAAATIFNKYFDE